MRSVFFIVLFFLIMPALNGQDLNVLYELKVKDRRDSVKSKIYSLDISKKESVFRSVYQKTSDSLLAKRGTGYGYSLNIDEQLYIQKKLDTREIKKVIVSPIMRDRVFIKIQDSFNWTVFPENKKIGDFKCQKAELNYGGRLWTAWFTEDIPLSDGPYVFNGLPGLIIQIQDSELNFDFQLISVNNNKEGSLYIPKEGKQVSLEAFNKMRQDYYTDPFSYVKSIGIKTMEDDGSGGMKKINFKEKTEMIRKTIRNTNVIEVNQKVDYDSF